MERNPPDKQNSFSHNSSNDPTLNRQQSSSSSTADGLNRSCSLKNDATWDSGDVDRFIEALQAMEDKASGLSEVPEFIHEFSRNIELTVQKYSSSDAGRRFGQVAEDDSDFLDSVRRLSRLINALCEFGNVDSLLNETTVALHRAAVFLEEEFRTMVEDSRNNNCDPTPENAQNFHKFSSFNSKQQQQDHGGLGTDRREADSGDYPPYPPEAVSALQEIASTMVSVGYEAECIQAYFLSRRIAIRNHLKKLEFEVLNMDDVAKMPWQSLETVISRWIGVVKTFSDVVFPGEKNLGESVFVDSPEVYRRLYSNLVRVVVVQLLDFPDATALTKLSVEKLFKYLDMYEVLRNNLIRAIYDEPCSDDLIAEVSTIADRIGESAVSIFSDLENSIKSDAARTPVPGGAVHPLTRYVMNYLKYACEYKGSLEEIFGKHTDLSMPVSGNLSCQDLDKETESPHNFETMAGTTPFAIQVVTVMDLLDANLDRKSRLYKDPSLQYIFLMNNGRYILQKVKGSPEIRQVMGDTWCRRRSTVVRQYHKNYQRETWNRVLQCINHEGIIVNGKVNKPLLKERFKTFTTIFEEIHRTQSGWVVSDDQLQSELRISISAVLIPAYRSFVGRFKHHLDAGRVEKYIKYQPEDVELLIEGLFEGNNNASMGKRRL